MRSNEPVGDPAKASPSDNGDGLRVLTPDECEEGPEAPYVLKGLVEAQNGVTAVGAPGVGKSVLVPTRPQRAVVGRAIAFDGEE